MRCPVCKTPMLIAEIDGIELDYCAQDFGVWFDEGEIEALFEANAPVLLGGKSGTKGKRRCPRCNVRMHVVHPKPNLELDACPYGDGIWFDAGEIEQLAQSLEQDGTKECADLETIFAKLANLFGEQKQQ